MSTPTAEAHFTFRSLENQIQKSNMVQCFEAVLKFLNSNSEVERFDENTRKKYQYLSEQLLSSTRQIKDLETAHTLSFLGSSSKLDKDIISNLETKYEEIDDLHP